MFGLINCISGIFVTGGVRPLFMGGMCNLLAEASHQTLAASHPSSLLLVDHWVSLGVTSHHENSPRTICLSKFMKPQSLLSSHLPGLGRVFTPPVLDPFTDLKAAEKVVKSLDQDYCCGQAKLQTHFWGVILITVFSQELTHP